MFVMVRGSDEESDNLVVWCNPKNSNGPLTPRSAWDRNGAGFKPSQDFDWHDFDQPPENRKKITLDDLRDLFDETLEMELSTAAEKLADIPVSPKTQPTTLYLRPAALPAIFSAKTENSGSNHEPFIHPNP
jgi:hypothetical protein